MVTKIDIRIAFRKETGHLWDDEVEKNPEVEYLLEKLLKHENDFLELIQLFDDDEK